MEPALNSVVPTPHFGIELLSTLTIDRKETKKSVNHVLDPMTHLSKSPVCPFAEL